MRTSFLNSFVKNPISSNFKTILSNKDMIKQTIGTQTIYKKKYPVRKKKMPFRSEHLSALLVEIKEEGKV